jgi:hypothetical protein
LVRTSIEGQSIADGFYEELIGSMPLADMSALAKADIRTAKDHVRSSHKIGHVQRN